MLYTQSPNKEIDFNHLILASHWLFDNSHAKTNNFRNHFALVRVKSLKSTFSDLKTSLKPKPMRKTKNNNNNNNKKNKWQYLVYWKFVKWYFYRMVRKEKSEKKLFYEFKLSNTNMKGTAKGWFFSSSVKFSEVHSKYSFNALVMKGKPSSTFARHYPKPLAGLQHCRWGRNIFGTRLFCCIGTRNKCGAMCNLAPFVKFKKREKHSWRSFTFSKVAG